MLGGVMFLFICHTLCKRSVRSYLYKTYVFRFETEENCKINKVGRRTDGHRERFQVPSKTPF